MSRNANPATGPLGRMLQSAREAVNMTQSELAEAIGLTQQTVSRWESGRILPAMDHFPAVAKVLKIDVDELASAAVKQAQITPAAPLPNRMQALEQTVAEQQKIIAEMSKRLGIADKSQGPRRRRRA